MNYLLCFLPLPLGVTRKTVKFNLCTKRTDKNLLLHELKVRKTDEGLRQLSFRDESDVTPWPFSRIYSG